MQLKHKYVNVIICANGIAVTKTKEYTIKNGINNEIKLLYVKRLS
jgi:hypothetical protein